MFAAILAGAVLTLIVAASLPRTSTPWSVLALEFGLQGFIALCAGIGACLTWRQTYARARFARVVAYFFLALVASSGTFLGVELLLYFLRSLGVPTIAMEAPFKQAGLGFGWMLLLTTVLAPASEELAFRGLLQPGLARYAGGPWAVVITAAGFAMAHLSVISFPHLFVMGLALGYVRQKSGSIWPCIAMHAGHNYLVSLLAWYPEICPPLTGR